MPLTDNEVKGKALMAEAKLAKGVLSPFISLFGIKGDEKAIDCYERAADFFKLAKKYSNAGEALAKAAVLYLKADNRQDCACSYVYAAHYYRKTNMKEAIACLEKAIEQFVELKNFLNVSNHHSAIAEILEGQGDLEKAIHHYEQAVDYYKRGGSYFLSNLVLLNAGACAALMEDYPKAIKAFEEVGIFEANAGCFKYCAKEYFAKAAICHLCVNVVDCQEALGKYVDIYPEFKGSEDFDWVEYLAFSVKTMNPKLFTAILKEYEFLHPPDNWHKTLFARIKKAMMNTD